MECGNRLSPRQYESLWYGNSLVKEVVSAAAPAVEKAAESRAKAKAQRMEDESQYESTNHNMRVRITI
jgi:hypothetical protein